jgi:cytochrome P450
MLATLLGAPSEDRPRLGRWSDIAVGLPVEGIATPADRQAELLVCLDYFTRLWDRRAAAAVAGDDLISMLARGEATRDMPPMEILGTIVLLLIGGTDTTRSVLSGGLYALSRHPEQEAKLRANPALIPSMVSEIVRWQTPGAYMRRTALRDVELGGKTIKRGDKVVMWYVSGNRDETVIKDPDAFIIDRENPRRHLSYGFGIHRCVGSRLAEMQLRIVWEEILERFPRLDVLDEPERVYSAFVTGYERMMVRIPERL